MCNGPENSILTDMFQNNRRFLIRSNKKTRGKNKGRIKAIKFFKMIFTDNVMPKESTFTKYPFTKYRGIFTKTRDGRYFNREIDRNNKKISRINDYTWNIEAMENTGVCRIFIKKARGMK